MATQIKRLTQNGQEFVPITLAEAVVVNLNKITTLDVVLREILGNDADLSGAIDTINTTLQTQSQDITTIKGAVSDLESSKQDKLTFNSSQFQIDENNNVTLINDFKLFTLVSELPTTNIDKNTIYLVQYEGGIPSNYLKEYVYTENDTWEEFGQIQIPEEIDLSGYITRNEYTLKIGSLEETITTNTENISSIQSSLQTIQGSMITASDVTGSDGTIVKVDYEIPADLYDVALGIETDHIVK